VLTFLLNYIPYLGSVVACALPIVLAFLQLEPGWQPITVAILLIADHVLSGNVVEPALTGKAIGLSPLVIVLALAFWGLCWGVIGMLLAVPLTVVFKIVLEHLPPTRPLALLMGEG
jgi:AI-2 transport protein TqsA